MRKILLQLDTDNQPSSFDSIVAIDAGVDDLLRYQHVEPVGVTSLVHGAMFTRGGEAIRNTAIFIGGSEVSDAEDLMKACQKVFFGPVRVSIMLDANGCNTTASAAVVAAMRHVDLSGSRAAVLGGTGPVGRRVALLLAMSGCEVTVTSRSAERAQKAADEMNANADGESDHSASDQNASDSRALISGAAMNTAADAKEVCTGVQMIFGCGAAGVELIDEATIDELSALKVAIDLNAVPPAGIGGIEVTDKKKPFGNGSDAVGYGAIGVGGLKMKTHRAAIQSLFESNDRVLDAAEIFEIAKGIG